MSSGGGRAADGADRDGHLEALVGDHLLPEAATERRRHQHRHEGDGQPDAGDHR